MIAFFIVANLVFFGVVVVGYRLSIFCFLGGFTVAMKLNFPSSLRLDLWCKETRLKHVFPFGKITDSGSKKFFTVLSRTLAHTNRRVIKRLDSCTDLRQRVC